MPIGFDPTTMVFDDGAVHRVKTKIKNCKSVRDTDAHLDCKADGVI